MARPRVAAGALFFDDAGRVLLVRPSYKSGWDIPGGYVEPGESPLQACIREVEEELGIRPAVGRLLVVDWAPHPDEGDKLLFVFDGGVLAPAHLEAVSAEAGEIAEWAFQESTTFDDLMPQRLVRRLLTALAARTDEPGAYAENGVLPTPSI